MACPSNAAGNVGYVPQRNRAVSPLRPVLSEMERRICDTVAKGIIVTAIAGALGYAAVNYLSPSQPTQLNIQHIPK